MLGITSIVLKGFPVFSSIELNIHGSCNRRCAFCPRVDETQWPNLDEMLDLEFFKKLLSELKIIIIKEE